MTELVELVEISSDQRGTANTEWGYLIVLTSLFSLIPPLNETHI